MKKHSYLEKNIELLKSVNTKLAYQLLTIDPSEIEFCYTQQEQLNLKRLYQGNEYTYHSPIDVKSEANSWFQSLNLKQETTLFVYGIGLGYYFEAAKEWLKKNPKHELVFLEIDLAVIHRLLETKLGQQILKHPQVKIFHFQNVLEDNEIFNLISWLYFQTPFKISCLKLYAEENLEGFVELEHRLTHDMVNKVGIVDEYMQYSVPFFRNFYPNLMELPKAHLGNGLFNEFKNIPAIICGAGPSLNKNSDLLKKLTKKALIFGGSSSLPAIISKGIIPHFGGAIDPNSSQLGRVKSVQGYGIPFFYRNRLYYEALQSITGPRLYITGTGGYEISEWFEEQLKILGKEDIDEGNNVINFCMAIAHALGCNPIILVGVDLAFTDQQYYAEGVISTLKLEEKDLKEGDERDLAPILKEDIYGKPILTLWKWVTESEWISKFAKDHSDVTVINSTEGGLGFKDIPNITLKGVEKKYLKKNHNLQSDIKKKIEKHKLNISKKKLIQLVRQFQDSLGRSIRYLDTLIAEFDRLLGVVKEGGEVSENPETPVTLLAEMEINDEIAHQYLLGTFNMVYLKCRDRDIKEIKFSKRKVKKSVRTERILRLHKERLIFLKQAAQINIGLIDRFILKKSILL